MAATYHLQVVSLDGLDFEGEVQKIMLRTIDGDVEILARHTDYCTAIITGLCIFLTRDLKSTRTSSCR